MTFRMLNLLVIGALVFAAAYVYRIKFDSTVQAERLAKIRGEVRRARDAIASLRAEWGELDNPARIEALTKRYLPLKPVTPTQFDTFDRLPERPPQFFKADSPDPIGAAIEKLEASDTATGSVAAPPVSPPGDASEAEAPTTMRSVAAPAASPPDDTSEAEVPTATGSIAAPGVSSPDDASEAEASDGATGSVALPAVPPPDDAGEADAPMAKSGRLDR
jgi:hypothetical protein